MRNLLLEQQENDESHDQSIDAISKTQIFDSSKENSLFLWLKYDRKTITTFTFNSRQNFLRVEKKLTFENFFEKYSSQNNNDIFKNYVFVVVFDYYDIVEKTPFQQLQFNPENSILSESTLNKIKLLKKDSLEKIIDKFYCKINNLYEDASGQFESNQLLKECFSVIKPLFQLDKNIIKEKDCCYVGLIVIFNLIYPEKILNIDSVIESNFQKIKKVEISKQTYENLLIFKEEIHPSMIKGKGRSKEDLSLFSTMTNMCNTLQGKYHIEKVLRNPIRSISTIKYRHEIIGYIIGLPAESQKVLLKSLKQIVSFKKFFTKVSNVKADLPDWSRFVNSLIKIGQIADLQSKSNFCKKFVRKFFSVRKMMELLSDFLEKIQDFKSASIQNSYMSENYFVIKNGVDEKLDELRRLFDRMKPIIDGLQIEERSMIQGGHNQLEFLKVIFVPELGYLILLKLHQKEVADFLASKKEKNNNTIIYGNKLVQNPQENSKSSTIFDKMKNNLSQKSKETNFQGSFQNEISFDQNDNARFQSQQNSENNFENQKLTQNGSQFQQSINQSFSKNEDLFESDSENKLKSMLFSQITANLNTVHEKNYIQNEIKKTQFLQEYDPKYDISFQKKPQTPKGMFQEYQSNKEKTTTNKKNGQNFFENSEFKQKFDESREPNKEGDFAEDQYSEKDLELILQELNISSEWNLLFERNGNIFFKSENTEALDEKLGNLRKHIIEIQLGIMSQIEEFVDLHKDFQLHVEDFVGELDCYFAMAMFSVENELKPPKITRSNLYMIKKVFHPLSKFLLIDRTQVKNNYFCADVATTNQNDVLSIYMSRFKNMATEYFEENFEDNTEENYNQLQSEKFEDFLINWNYSNKVCLLTAPNYSGKSFFGKIICLSIYLAHIGMYVNAENSLIGLTDSIIFMGNSFESFLNHENSLSFTELVEQNKILNKVTNRSFVVFDELGKNLSSKEKMALCLSVLDKLTLENNQNSLTKILKKYQDVPSVLLITHNTSQLTWSLVQENYLLRFVTMDTIIYTKNSSEPINVNKNRNILKVLDDPTFNLETSDLVPLFSFRPGFAVRSLGIFISKNYDIGEIFYKKFLEYCHEDAFKEKLKPDEAINEIYVKNVKSKAELVLGYFVENDSNNNSPATSKKQEEMIEE